MKKYALETKLEAVKAYLDGVESLRGIAKKYKVSKTMLGRWVAKYQKDGQVSSQERYTKYSVEFKMDVIKYINETGVSIEEAALIFNVGSSTLWNWIQSYEAKGMDALQPKAKERPPMKRDSKKKQPIEGSQEALLAELEYLRMENAYLKKLKALVQEEKKSQSGKKHK